MTLRPALPEDAAAMARVLGDWVAETAWMPRLHSAEDHVGFCSHLIATQDVTVLALPQVAGFLALDGTTISALYLAPAARGQGHGRALLSEAQSLRPHLSLWTFQANTGARRFYGRAGFAEVELTDGAGNEEHLPDVRMTWERTT